MLGSTSLGVEQLEDCPRFSTRESTCSTNLTFQKGWLEIKAYLGSQTSERRNTALVQIRSFMIIYDHTSLHRFGKSLFPFYYMASLEALLEATFKERPSSQPLVDTLLRRARAYWTLAFLKVEYPRPVAFKLEYFERAQRRAREAANDLAALVDDPEIAQALREAFAFS